MTHDQEQELKTTFKSIGTEIFHLEMKKDVLTIEEFSKHLGRIKVLLKAGEKLIDTKG
ncbi:MAG: hypothetical protein AABY22_25730 [Nanoarchaeota archaeon]